MKNLGWYFFFALLISDAIALLMLKLAVAIKTTLLVAGLVFIVLAAVMFFGSQARKRIKKREAQAVAKIAELQDQMEETIKQKKEILTKQDDPVL